MEYSEIEILKRKLAETEARISSRLLLSAQQSLDQTDYEMLCNKFEENAAIDLLELERDISQSATVLSENLHDLYLAVKDFRNSHVKLNEIESGFWDPRTNKDIDPQMVLNQNIAAREKMFSLLDEYDLKSRFIKHLQM